MRFAPKHQVRSTFFVISQIMIAMATGSKQDNFRWHRKIPQSTSTYYWCDSFFVRRVRL